MDWIDTCEYIVALASKDLLRDILERIDLSPENVVVAAGPTRIVRELFPYDSIPTRTEYTKRRKEVGAMLQRKGVLKACKVIQERDWRGQTTGVGWNDELKVQADRATVHRVLWLLDERLNPTTPTPPVSRPRPTASVEPEHSRQEEPPRTPTSATPTATSPVAELGHEYRKEVVGELGRKTGGLIWWLLGALLLTALGLIPQTRTAAVTWVRGAIHEVFSADTTRTK